MLRKALNLYASSKNLHRGEMQIPEISFPYNAPSN
jgi:hypothetical protein